MMTTDVKFFREGMAGAPTLSGTAGSLVGLLDACLVDGFGLGTVDSLVVAGAVATVTRGAGHPFVVNATALIAGATPSALNGEHRVLSVTGSTYTFAATGVSDQTATGSITHKVAPAGWTKLHSGTNLAAYKSLDPSATGGVLRVDDSNATNARVVGYESMTDINTGTAPFPTAAQQSGGGYWGKSATADATTRGWFVIADSRAFYIGLRWSGTTAYATQFFGDFASRKSPDPYCCALSMASVSPLGQAPSNNSSQDMAWCFPILAGGSSSNMWAMRNTSGLGSSTPIVRQAPGFMYPGGVDRTSGSITGNLVSYPNAADNGLYVSPLPLMEASPDWLIRGEAPGFYACLQKVGPSVFQTHDLVTGVPGLAGRSLNAVVSTDGVQFVDLTGPWR